MPELPEMEACRRALAARGLGRRVAAVAVPRPRQLRGLTAARLRRALQGRALNAARRHGKHLLARIAGDGGWPCTSA